MTVYTSTKKVANALKISRESAGRLLLKRGWTRRGMSGSTSKCTIYEKEV